MAKVIVITGGSAGIGAALARKLGAAGHSLCLGARREPELKAAAAAASQSTVAVVMDATRRADVERLRDEAVKAFGHVDVWVNNAGRGINRSVQQLSDDDFDQMMAINVKSALYGIQAILPHFKERGAGHIVNVSSFLGRVPFVTVRSAYNAAKHALNALTANLRVELRSTHPGIKVSLVMPGVVTTDFAKNAMGDPPQPFRGGMMKPQNAEEVAEVMAELIEHPVAEVYTNPALHDLAVQYISDVGGFEERAAQAAKG